MALFNRHYPLGIEIPNTPFLLVLSSVLALAVLLGAIIGGLRNLARAPDLPLAVYIPAALVVGSLSVGLLWLATQFGIGPPAADGATDQKAPLAIGWVMPTFIFLAILLRGRCPMRRSGWLELCSDVAMLAGVMLVSLVVMMVVGTMVGLPAPGLGDPRSVVLMMVLALAQSAGVGGLVLRPVRKAATMNVVIRGAGRGGSARELVAWAARPGLSACLARPSGHSASSPPTLPMPVRIDRQERTAPQPARNMASPDLERGLFSARFPEAPGEPVKDAP
jgi:hypothetical protein